MIEYKTNSLTVPEIEHFISRHDANGFFGSRELYYKNFTEHFLRLLKAEQVLAVRDNNKLIGFCSWAVVHREDKQKINKVRWLLPEDISSGDILYIDVCVLEPQASIHKIKAYLRERYLGSIREVFWYNMGAGKVYRKHFKKEMVCQTVG